MQRLLHAPSPSFARARPLPIFASLRRSIFVKTETTPNPQSLKFLTGEQILPAHLGTGMVSDPPSPPPSSLSSA